MSTGRSHSWDAVVVGGGLVGCSAAYHLAQAGMRTLLIEQGDLASGASGGNFGRVQILDSEMGLSLELNLQGHALISTLEDALDFDLGYQASGYMLLIENERQWAIMEKRASALQSAGVDAQLLDSDDLLRLEPNLATDAAIGALYHAEEAVLNPFALVHAYTRRGRDRGLEVWTHTAVTGIESQSGSITGVHTAGGSVGANWVILAAGAWTRCLTRTVGLDIPLLWVHGEALVTESLPPIVMNGLISASFFEETEGADGQTVGFCLAQRPEGNALIGESAFVTERLGRRVTGTALPAIAAQAQQRFPALRRASVIRSWAIPVPFTADNKPLLGSVDGLDGLVVATGLKSTIILTPLVGKLVRDMVDGCGLDPRLDSFSPTRRMRPAASYLKPS